MNMKNNSNKQTRGQRNNNPLNIRRSSSAWLGKVPHDLATDRSFEQFTDMAYGYRAACRLIDTYVKRWRCRTVYEIINRWAPAADGNNVGAYVATVAKRTGLQATTTIATDDDILRLVCGMAYVESRLVITPDELRALFEARLK
jgi:hypothetical protein